MSNKPFLLRSFFALIVVAVFVASMFPLSQSDFYDTLTNLLQDPKNAEVEKVVAKAKEIVASSKTTPSTATDMAATELGINLTSFVKPGVVKAQKLLNNSDVISLVRKNAAGSIRLGIDLNGGIEFMLQLKPNDPEFKSTEFNRFRDQAIETMRRRLETQNIYETEISPAGADLVSLRAPVSTNDEKDKLEKLIRMTAKLQFKLVAQNSNEEVGRYLASPKSYEAPEGTEIMETTEIDEKSGKLDKRYFLVERETQMDGKEISNAYVQMNNYGQREIAFSMKQSGAVKFGEITTKNVGRQLAIILDGRLYSAPNIATPITGGAGQITGNFSKDDAENIANALISGSVPFKIEVVSKSDIDSTLGTETITAGIYSGIFGTLLVILFMLFYYRLSGVVATISLVANAALILGALAAFNVTLTLPGIAGIILTIGMAVDANVLIYERIREELKNGKTVLNAVEIGFNRAFSAIFDSNLTTLFTALILMWQGTGAVKGFAMTLAIGIFTTLFTAVFLTHLIFDIIFRIPWIKITDLKMCSILKNPSFDFLGMRKVAIGISLVLMIASVAVFCIKGKDALGIDFTGGTQIELSFDRMIPQTEVDAYLKSIGYEPKVTYKTDNAVSSKRIMELLIRQHSVDTKLKDAEGKALPLKDAITDQLNRKFQGANFKAFKEDTLGALIGWTFTKTAIMSLALAMLGMVIYMVIRFELSYSIAANVAVLHDAVIAVGIYVMCGGQITLQVVASVLTLIGYSINDTIVTFDRQRENLRLLTGTTYWDVINLSINQTFSRTLLTSLSVLLILLTQFFFGGPGIRDFISVMIIGCFVGCYSSIFVASTIVAYWHKSVAHISNAVTPEVVDPTVPPAA